MNCTRRTFLATSTTAMLSLRMTSAGPTRVAFLVLQDVPADWGPSDLTSVLESLRRNDLPVMFILPEFGETNAGESEKQLHLAASIRADLIELVSSAPTVVLKQRYWHLRAAHDHKRAIGERLEGTPVPATLPNSVTYFENSKGQPTDLVAYRSAGFRVRIVGPETSSPAEVVVTGRDQLSISGGYPLDLFGSTLERDLAALPSGEEFTVLHISLANGAKVSGEGLSRTAEASLEQLATALRHSAVYPRLVRDYFLSGGRYIPRDIALLLDGAGADASGSIANFAKELGDLGLPFTQMVRASDAGDCALALTSQTTSPATCIAAVSVPTGTDAGAMLTIGANEVNGLGDDDRMHFAALRSDAAARLDRLTLDESDRVMRIGVVDVENPLARARLVRRLADGQNLGQVRLHTVEGLRDRVLANDPVLRRYWSLKARRISDPVGTAPPDTAERALLLEDAALAWSYFDRYIYSDTGLAPGTVSAVPGGRLNSEVTLWDVGSQINAIIAAADLRIVSVPRATDMLLKAVAALPTEQLSGRTLPPSNFSAQTLRTTVTGFDSCDTGRFGIALARAVERGLLSRDAVLETIKDWELAEAIREGKHFTHRGRRWQDTSQSHCTDYIVPGFQFFGQEVRPLQTHALPAPASEIATLYRTASLGSIATEPYALQAIESGMDAPTKLILDALFDAQLGWFEDTGTLRCVSETPIDRSPWFLYSGLRLDAEGPDAWVVGALANTADNLSDASAIVGSKAAYLWKAAYPHPYNDRLVALVREHAKIPGHGFSVGVHSETLQAVPNYTDINTNGIILTAIAHILGQQ